MSFAFRLAVSLLALGISVKKVRDVIREGRVERELEEPFPWDEAATTDPTPPARARKTDVHELRSRLASLEALEDELVDHVLMTRLAFYAGGRPIGWRLYRAVDAVGRRKGLQLTVSIGEERHEHTFADPWQFGASVSARAREADADRFMTELGMFCDLVIQSSLELS